MLQGTLKGLMLKGIRQAMPEGTLRVILKGMLRIEIRQGENTKQTKRNVKGNDKRKTKRNAENSAKGHTKNSTKGDAIRNTQRNHTEGFIPVGILFSIILSIPSCSSYSLSY